MLNMTTHHSPQSLPSFAQAFSTSSLSNIHAGNNSLPPIQARSSYERFHRKDTPSVGSRDHSQQPSIEQNPSRPNGRKRVRDDESLESRDEKNSTSGPE